jgi:nucleotide-binding universal stress UspA family protein
MTFHKILCPIDFSPGSQQAMRAAVRLASQLDAELVLAHAWYVPPVAFAGDYVLSPEVMQELNDDAQAAIDRAAHEAAALGARRLSTKLLAGMPRHEIQKILAHDPTFDLVVLGTHGRTGLERVLLGSIAEAVVRHAPCSVLTVRPDKEPGPFARILCPIDFSDASQHAVDLAAQLAQPGGGAAGEDAGAAASITLLHVIDPPAVYTRGPRALDLVHDLDRYATEHLDQWAARLAAKTSAPIVKRSRVGHPGAEILAVLDEPPPFDLVVMGSHGRVGLERILLGSVAEKLVRHAHCPVLVARKRA